MIPVEATGSEARASRDAEELALEVLEALDGHCASYEDLMALLEAQREALRDNDLERLGRILLGQDEILARVALREERRHATYTRMLALAGVEDDEVEGLEDLAERMGLSPGIAARARDSRGRLSQLTAEVRSLNETNGALVSEALKFVDFSLETIRQMAVDGMTYRDGDGGDGPPSMLMDRRL